jgi:hypothetical protein
LNYRRIRSIELGPYRCLLSGSDAIGPGILLPGALDVSCAAHLTDYQLKLVGFFATESRVAAEGRLKNPRLTAGSRLGGRGDLESLGVVVPLLVLDVLLDRFLVHRAHRRAKVPPCPQVLPPELFS